MRVVCGTQTTAAAAAAGGASKNKTSRYPQGATARCNIRSYPPRLVVCYYPIAWQIYGKNLNYATQTKQAATHKGQRLDAIFVSVSLTVKPFALVLLHGKYTAKTRISKHRCINNRSDVVANKPQVNKNVPHLRSGRVMFIPLLQT